MVTRIELEPRQGNNTLVKGVLHIEEEEWSVVYFELEERVAGGRSFYKTMFHEVSPGVYLPTSYDIEFEMIALGMTIKGNYYSGIKYKEITCIDEKQGVLPFQGDTSSLARSPRQERVAGQLKELHEKTILSAKEARQVVRLTQGMMAASRQSDSLWRERRQPAGQYEEVEVHALANSRDSLFWDTIRSFPLNAEEKQSYQRKKGEKPLNAPGSSLLGGFDIRVGDRLCLNIAGLPRVVPVYNFVDGFWVGFRASAIRSGRSARMELIPSLYYTTARKGLNWSTEMRGRYGAKQAHHFSLKAGDQSMDYKQAVGGSLWGNSVTAFLLGNSDKKFYRARFIHLSHSAELWNGFHFQVRGAYQKRSTLENRTTFNLRGVDPGPNIPDVLGGVEMTAHQALTAAFRITYNPRVFYRLVGGRKRDLKTAWPTFHVDYERGFMARDRSGSDYHRLEAGLIQTVKINTFNTLEYVLSAGKFFSVKSLHFPDFKHFEDSGWRVHREALSRSFFMGGYYQHSTADKWLQATMDYSSFSLFLKKLPFLEMVPFDETFHLRGLWVPHLKNYMEMGYSVGFDRFLRVGIFCNFEQMSYHGVGIRVCLFTLDRDGN